MILILRTPPASCCQHPCLLQEGETGRHPVVIYFFFYCMGVREGYWGLEPLTENTDPLRISEILLEQNIPLDYALLHPDFSFKVKTPHGRMTTSAKYPWEMSLGAAFLPYSKGTLGCDTLHCHYLQRDPPLHPHSSAPLAVSAWRGDFLPSQRPGGNEEPPEEGLFGVGEPALWLVGPPPGDGGLEASPELTLQGLPPLFLSGAVAPMSAMPLLPHPAHVSLQDPGVFFQQTKAPSIWQPTKRGLHLLPASFPAARREIRAGVTAHVDEAGLEGGKLLCCQRSHTTKNC